MDVYFFSFNFCNFLILSYKFKIIINMIFKQINKKVNKILKLIIRFVF